MNDLPTNVIEINQGKETDLNTSAISCSTDNQTKIAENGVIQAEKPHKPWLFQPGQSGNPSGRPKCALVSEKLREVLKSEDTSGSTGAERLGNKLVALADQDKDGYLALAAIREVIDRVEGKAIQTSHVKGLIALIPAQNTLEEEDRWAAENL